MTATTWTPATVCGECVTLETFRRDTWHNTYTHDPAYIRTCDTCGDTTPGGRYYGALLVTIRGTR